MRSIVPAPLGALPPADIPPFQADSWLGLLLCNGVGVEVIWVGPHNTRDLEAEARRLVEEYVARVPVPRITVEANPLPTGLVGLESWFWATVYDRRPIVDRIDALGIGVDVRIDPTPVTWTFGDGSSASGVASVRPGPNAHRSATPTSATAPGPAVPDCPPAHNVARGEIKEISYLGDSTIFHGQLSSGQLLRVSRPNRSRYEQEHFGWGDTVWVSWTGSSPVVLLS